MFARPNGSGKSTLKNYLPAKLLGVYLNPDEIEQGMRESGVMDFTAFGVQPGTQEIAEFFAGSTLLKGGSLERDVERLIFREGVIEFRDVQANSYFASVAVELLRHQLVRRQISFTFRDGDVAQKQGGFPH